LHDGIWGFCSFGCFACGRRWGLVYCGVWCVMCSGFVGCLGGCWGLLCFVFCVVGLGCLFCSYGFDGYGLYTVFCVSVSWLFSLVFGDSVMRRLFTFEGFLLCKFSLYRSGRRFVCMQASVWCLLCRVCLCLTGLWMVFVSG